VVGVALTKVAHNSQWPELITLAYTIYLHNVQPVVDCLALGINRNLLILLVF
jgi:hypothetical protein